MLPAFEERWRAYYEAIDGLGRIVAHGESPVDAVKSLFWFYVRADQCAKLVKGPPDLIMVTPHQTGESVTFYREEWEELMLAHLQGRIEHVLPLEVRPWPTESDRRIRAIRNKRGQHDE